RSPPRQWGAPAVDDPEAARAPRRELATVGVDREIAPECDARAAVDERAALAPSAEPERLQPEHGEDAEAVVQAGDVHVGGAERRAIPHLRGGTGARPE